jgi:hypothetical protein
MFIETICPNETGNFPKAELLCQVLNLDKHLLQVAERMFVTIVATSEDAGAVEPRYRTL